MIDLPSLISLLEAKNCIILLYGTITIGMFPPRPRPRPRADEDDDAIDEKEDEQQDLAAPLVGRALLFLLLLPRSSCIVVTTT